MEPRDLSPRRLEGGVSVNPLHLTLAVVVVAVAEEINSLRLPSLILPILILPAPVILTPLPHRNTLVLISCPS
jgi:hypothetical protein